MLTPAGYRCRTCGRLSHDPSGNCEHGAEKAEPLYAGEPACILECDCDLLAQNKRPLDVVFPR